MKLNKIERLKAQLSPLAFGSMLEKIDLGALNEEERFYLKNFGIYNIKLEPQRFMIRLRIAGGRIESERLEWIAKLAKSYGLKLLLTARAQIEMHGLHAGNVLEVWQLLQESGLTSFQTLTDNFRNIVTDPYDGMDQSSQIEVYSLIEQMQALFLGQEEWMGMLPRKFNTAICGTQRSHTHFFSNDLYFALASKEGRWGFNLYLGGKNSQVAQDADLFVEAAKAVAMFRAVAYAYKTYGLRGTRSKTRLFHLLEEIGMDRFRAHIGEFYPYTLESKGVRHQSKEAFSAFRELKEGSYGYCLQTRFGEIENDTLLKVCTYAQEQGAQIRLGIDQNLYLLGLEAPSVPFEPVRGAAQVTACAGSSYCALSLWDIKTDTRYLPLKRIEKYQIQVGFSGCLKGCGRHQHADIGLVGLRTNAYGQTQKAARVYLGGEYSEGKRVARLIFPIVPLKYLKELLNVVIDCFVHSGEVSFEEFSRKYLSHLSSDFILLWFLSKLHLGFDIPLEASKESHLYDRLCKIEGFPFFEDDHKYLKSSKTLMHALWDDLGVF